MGRGSESSKPSSSVTLLPARFHFLITAPDTTTWWPSVQIPEPVGDKIWMRNVPHRPRYWNTWCCFWRKLQSVALLEKVYHWGLALTVYTPAPILVHELCFLLEDLIVSLLPLPLWILCGTANFTSISLFWLWYFTMATKCNWATVAVASCCCSCYCPLTLPLFLLLPFFFKILTFICMGVFPTCM